MSESAPDVAVIIAGYKAERVISRAVKSALSQPEAREVIVVIDASPDKTAEVARAADDGSGRLRVIEQKTNRGPAAARNVAIAASTSAWITVLDDDDFMEASRLARLLALRDQWDFIADDLLLVQEGAEDGPRTPMWYQGPAHAGAETITLESFVNANTPDPARSRRELGFLKPLMRRAFLEQHRLAYDETMRLGEDYDLYARALAAGARFALFGAQGYVAVRRQDSLSGKHGAKDLLALRAADDKLLQSAALSAGEKVALQRHRLSTDKRYQWQRLIDAIKAKDVGEAAACFFSDAQTSAYLISQLSEQFRLRVLKI